MLFYLEVRMLLVIFPFEERVRGALLGMELRLV